jgi:light-harvesting complex 1 beta chain
MNAIQSTHAAQQGSPARNDWRGTVFLVFMVVLGVALVAQLTGMNWRSWFPGAEGQSFFQSISSATYTLIAHIS